MDADYYFEELYLNDLEDALQRLQEHTVKFIPKSDFWAFYAAVNALIDKIEKEREIT